MNHKRLAVGGCAAVLAERLCLSDQFEEICGYAAEAKPPTYLLEIGKPEAFRKEGGKAEDPTAETGAEGVDRKLASLKDH